jgi:tetratricopeptide (TPR) repeat protein
VPLKHFAPFVLCLIAAAFAVRTWVRNGDWQDERAMAEATLRASPNSYKAHEEMAAVLYANRPGEADRDRAIEEADRAVAILHSLPDALSNGTVYTKAGSFHLAQGDLLRKSDPSESARQYERALQLVLRAIAIDKAGRAEYDRKGGAEWARRHSERAVAAKGDPDPHWMLAAVYVRLGKAPEAGAAAGEALALHPANGEAYRQIAFAFAAQDRIDDAAVALMEGLLITGDLTLKSDLLELYRSAFANTCALTAGPDGPAVNPACDVVRKQFCAASVEVIKATLEGERWDEARKQKQDFLHKYGCPAGPLEQVLPD